MTAPEITARTSPRPDACRPAERRKSRRDRQGDGAKEVRGVGAHGIGGANSSKRVHAPRDTGHRHERCPRRVGRTETGGHEEDEAGERDEKPDPLQGRRLLPRRHAPADHRGLDGPEQDEGTRPRVEAQVGQREGEGVREERARREAAPRPPDRSPPPSTRGEKPQGQRARSEPDEREGACVHEVAAQGGAGEQRVRGEGHEGQRGEDGGLPRHLSREALTSYDTHSSPLT